MADSNFFSNQIAQIRTRLQNEIDYQTENLTISEDIWSADYESDEAMDQIIALIEAE